MKNINSLLIVALLVVSSSLSYAQSHQIGHTTITFQDTNRSNRNIQTEIYYPAQTAGTNTAAVQDTFPVVVFGHGFVMAWDAYQNIWEEFVPKGYIMVFPRTEGSLISTNHQEFGWDLQFLVTQMQIEGGNSGSIFYNVVAPETALMGHSMGGGAAFLAADSLSSNGNTNLKTLVGLAPAESSTNGVSSINSAKSVTVPSLVFSGSQDGVTPPADHHIPMYDSLASTCKTFVNIIGGAHCYFANSNFNCDFGEGTSSSGISISRAEQHDVYFDFLSLWLDYTLKYNCNSFDEFNDSLVNSLRITNNQICAANPIPAIIDNGSTLTSSIVGVSYLWYVNGTPIANSNQVSITPNQPGNYEVEVFFNDGCSETSAPYQIISTDIEQLNNEEFKLFPNPTNSIIQFLGVESLEGLVVFNSLGQTMDLKTVNDFTLDVANYPKGIYVVKINSKTKRVVVN